MNTSIRQMFKTGISALATLAIVLGATSTANALRIRDVVRMKNEVSNELLGMGLVVGLNGTGDGGDFLPTMRPLKEMMKKFDDPVAIEKELKNANNVAIVTVSMIVPPQGAHTGERLDVKVSALAAKSLRGGRLFLIPMMAPRADVKIILGYASGTIVLDNEKQGTTGTIRGGGVLIEDILPEEIVDTFTLVIHPEMAARELSTAIADQINEDVSPQTGGTPIAIALDATSIQVTIPTAERENKTSFIARLLRLPLPTLPDPARVTIDMQSKTIVFSEEVEVSPTMITQGNLVIAVGQQQGVNRAGPYAVIDPKGNGNAKLRDLQNAFNVLRVSADDQIAIVKELKRANVLKADLDVKE